MGEEIKENTITNELIQIRPSWYVGNRDVNIWSRVHPRFEEHNGCVVDLGCLGWNKKFQEITSDNWTGYFFGKKRVIGIDPQEVGNEYSELFKGFISTYTGKANLTSNGIAGAIIPDENGEYNVITWSDFKSKFDITSISILKVNIEGSEWDLFDSFDDFDSVDQICVSFHNFLPQFNNQTYHERTKHCINKIIENGYTMVDLGIYGWKLFLKNY
jgi:hypothetical protein